MKMNNEYFQTIRIINASDYVGKNPKEPDSIEMVKRFILSV